MFLNFFKILRVYLILGLIFLNGSVFAQTPATLADYWAGNAKWEFDIKHNFNDPAWVFDSSAIKVVGTNWYLFRRVISTNAACPGGNQLGTQVMRSTDYGRTWTTPVSVIVPTVNTPWACAATDGDAFYDNVNNKWRLLFQCLGADSIWRGCYAEKAGSDPLGSFVPVVGNPVIQPGSLWSQICNTSSDDCYTLSGGANKIKDEGTFNIFRFDGTYFWISFHGFDGAKGYRGIAKTIDFKTFYAGGSNGGSGEATPNDSVVDSKDGSSWREVWQAGGNIGAGHAPIIQENSYYYMLAEIADRSLACTAGQNWDFGLFRSSSITATTWEQFPLGNPIIYSSKQIEQGTNSLPCNLQYAQIFKDTTNNFFYLKYFRNSTNPEYQGTYFYRLVKSTNILKNGDLWTADATGWNKTQSATNLAVYRYPNSSPDGTQFLAANCGQASCSNNSIYQDVDVSAYVGRTYRFGGQFSTFSGTGGISLVVWQLDNNFSPIRQDTINITPQSGIYTNTSSAVYTIVSGTKYLRYQFYLNSPSITYYADNMFLNLN